jgi:integrase
MAGNRRRPYIARKTIGWNEKKHPQYFVVGYYETAQEALAALVEYNKNPVLFSPNTITFAEIFELWKAEKFKNLSESTKIGYLAAFKNSADLHEIKFVEIKVAHLMSVVNEIRLSGRGYSTCKKAKVLFSQLYAYAIMHEITDKDYSRYVNIGKNTPVLLRKPFSTRQINKLIKNIDEFENIDTILIMIYSGLRIGEFLNLKPKDIKLRERYLIVTESKTEAGHNRIVPINKKIFAYIEKRTKSGNKYLIVTSTGEKMTYHTYYETIFKKVMELLKMKHRIHDCRHTTATLLNNADANSTTAKRILGHASNDITERVYTHKTLKELRKAINLI